MISRSWTSHPTRPPSACAARPASAEPPGGLPGPDHTNLYLYLYMYMYTCVCIVQKHIYIHIYIYIYIYVCLRVCLFSCFLMYVGPSTSFNLRLKECKFIRESSSRTSYVVKVWALFDAVRGRILRHYPTLPKALLTGPKHRINIRILHSGSKAQHNGGFQKPWLVGS